MREWKNARGNCRCGTAGRTPRGVRKVPRIARRTEQAGLRGRHQSEFRSGAFPEDRHAGSEKSLGEGAGVIGNVIVIETGARGGTRARENLQVLQKKGHACERAIRKAPFKLALRVIVM